MEESPYTLAEVEAIHAAFTEALETPKNRDERMPSSAAAFRASRNNSFRSQQASGNNAGSTIGEIIRREGLTPTELAPCSHSVYDARTATRDRTEGR